MENTLTKPGYVTEKLFGAFDVPLLPVYWGPPDSYDFFPGKVTFKLNTVATSKDNSSRLIDFAIVT